jgi:hypothetical protein
MDCLSEMELVAGNEIPRVVARICVTEASTNVL